MHGGKSHNWPTDQYLHCFQNRIYSGLASLKVSIRVKDGSNKTFVT